MAASHDGSQRSSAPFTTYHQARYHGGRVRRVGGRGSRLLQSVGESETGRRGGGGGCISFGGSYSPVPELETVLFFCCCGEKLCFMWKFTCFLLNAEQLKASGFFWMQCLTVPFHTGCCDVKPAGEAASGSLHPSCPSARSWSSHPGSEKFRLMIS